MNFVYPGEKMAIFLYLPLSSVCPKQTLEVGNSVMANELISHII